MLNNTMSRFFQVLLPCWHCCSYVFYKLDTCNHYHRDGAFDGLRGRHDRKAEQKYFIGQQQALGAVNGYIEETVTGQKVIKVFCHEETVVEEFEFLSDNLREKQRKAQFFGSIMAPVMGNLSQISYALSATIGGVLCLTLNFDIGGLAIFTNYSRHFARPISELSCR